MIYHPRYLPDDAAFEILVHLVLQQEHPSERIRRRRPSDWGVDITRDDGSSLYAYQCKHLRQSSLSNLKQALRKSLVSAIDRRGKLSWRTFTLCTSEDLTGDQEYGCHRVAKELGLLPDEFHVRSGTQFIATLAKSPWIWEAVTNDKLVRKHRVPSSPDLSVWMDSRLRRIVEGMVQSGERVKLAELLGERGVLEVAMNDWYQMAAYYFASTHQSLRMIAFEEEIPGFWMTSAGHKYFNLNRQLIAADAVVNRIYVFDLGLAVSEPEVFDTMLTYVMSQVAAGICCRIIDRSAFAESLRISCALFGVQDTDNVALFSPDEVWVTIVRDPAFVSDAIDVFEELFHSRESIAPATLLRQ